MEETLGKRIVRNRKRLSMTQDQLAEKLGVTAQAVSKWENDQSCPDISTLPRLASIFNITVDELLGVERAVVGEIIEEEAQGSGTEKGLEFHWDPGRKSHLIWALAVLTVGVLTLLSNLLHWDVSLWSILWPVSIMVVGLLGDRFSFFRLGCVAVGGYFLLDNLRVMPAGLNAELLVPGLIILFGIALLVDSIHKPKKGKIHISRKGGKNQECDYNADGTSFTYTASFGEAVQVVRLDMLEKGEINTSFGEFDVDLSEVAAVAEGCHIAVCCSFGELNLLVPRRFSVRPTSSTSFAQINIEGKTDEQPQGNIDLDASVSFGEIVVRYI